MVKSGLSLTVLELLAPGLLYIASQLSQILLLSDYKERVVKPK